MDTNQTFTDAVKVGLANLVIFGVLSKLFPKDIPAQMFLSAALLHYTVEQMKVKNLI
jgi:hypothetical protein